MKVRIGTAIALSLILLAGGCAPQAGPAGVSPPDAHDARNSLDWAGAYRGVLPCADCEGIETVVTLGQDGRFREEVKYLGKGDGKVLTREGAFQWNDAGNVVTLEGDGPARYFVGENRITRLARDGSRITGGLADRYGLEKMAGHLTETYWKLVELNGRPVPRLEREPYLILKAEGGRVNGFGGCNSFSGSYTVDEAASRISFGQVASTMMACVSGMDVEQAFHRVLGQADNYSLNGDHLTLNRARMAPLARFEAVYLR
ncbi:META domain-containing protein [Sphingomonas fennica]|uniref:DUF306 domain-containing protein n=1 Tax=Edaphosphingomonas fennica TaxID=114404 RepID=A0A2T4I4D3_9SPHN|nr:META domain-containing protein [Sphingomonas fennica]PTD24253.1 hypothetical protein CV103_08495 [Sphingomonas fennica]